MEKEVVLACCLIQIFIALNSNWTLVASLRSLVAVIKKEKNDNMEMANLLKKFLNVKFVILSLHVKAR